MVFRIAVQLIEHKKRTLQPSTSVTALEFLADFYDHLLDGNYDKIINVDETPIYIDPTTTRTLDDVGARSIDVVDSGNNKSRITLVVIITGSGQIFPSYLLFKGITVFYCFYPMSLDIKLVFYR